MDDSDLWMLGYELDEKPMAALTKQIYEELKLDDAVMKNEEVKQDIERLLQPSVWPRIGSGTTLGDKLSEQRAKDLLARLHEQFPGKLGSAEVTVEGLSLRKKYVFALICHYSH